jgi:hypothetical protein
MHHYKIGILELQDIFVAKQHIFYQTAFQGFK